MQTITTTTTPNGLVKVAFDGITYFVKYTEAYRAQWLPVKSVKVNRLGDTLLVGGVYGVNCGQRQVIVNRKGQKVAEGTVFVKLSSFKVCNRTKLYTSSVVTEVTPAPVKRTVTNKRPTFSQVSAVRFAANYLKGHPEQLAAFKAAQSPLMQSFL